MDNTIHWLEPIAPLTSPAQAVTVGPEELLLHTPLHNRLLALKNDIDSVTPDGYWDDAKKITNPYEYIFLSLQRRMAWSIAALQPLSRSYFKMIELWDLLGLTATATAHSAEGPGGFLEAIQHRCGPIPMIAMTLKSTERTVPGWRKSQAFLHSYPDIHITYGADGTGNLYSLANQAAFTSTAKAHIGAADVYTADGGFDFSADFNGQESTVQRLLVAEALAGLTTLRQGGTMILKLFDMKCRATLEIMWTLSSCFENTALVKPKTSRPANSERYWIGRGYRGAPDWILTLFSGLAATDAPNGWSHLYAQTPAFPAAWITEIQIFQQKIELYQFNKIQITLNLIKTPTKNGIYTLLLDNIEESMAWCHAHKIPINSQYQGLTTEKIANLNLEEALAPFRASVARTNLQGLSQPPPTHRAWTGALPQRTPTGLAWRTALPASVLGRTPSQTAVDTPPSPEAALPQSLPDSFPSLAQL
jgi:23S rRNA U2552 (ribose-2'-O)-methylase RlmE/FtsJ